MRNFLITLIKKYQLKISPVIKPACRFQPTCSEYAIVSLQKYNLLIASLKIAIRIFRCNPFTKKGTVDSP
jgi:hypothetical protein